MTHRITVAERRARLVTRHRLAPGAHATDPADVARSLVALHATDPASVVLSVRARAPHVTPDDVLRAFVDDRSLVRWVAWRRTLWGVPREDLAEVNASATTAVAARERRSLLRLLEQSEVADDVERWLAHAEQEALAALTAAGEATTTELVDAVPALAAPVRLSPGRRWERTVRAGTLVAPLLAMQGLVVRTRPRGTWLSPQFTWATTRSWLGEPVRPVDPAAARAAVVRRWLRAFGPGTEADLRWWTGWTARDVRAALAAVPHTRVDLEGAVGVVLDDDTAPTPEPDPTAALLPTLDPTTMGWRDRDWYLDPSSVPLLVDGVGNAGPTVWWEGRVVGGWAQHPDGEVVTGLLEDVGTDARAAITRAAEELTAWLGPVRLAPGVLPPYQRSLVT